MIQRHLLSTLLEWKSSPKRKPLILRGARQVGKTTLVRHFAQSYPSFVYLNLEKSADARFFIDYGDNIKQIIEAITLTYNISPQKGSFLLFIDEIQEVPAAISLLRYFYEEVPGVDVISAGSLLEFALGDVPSFPVGRVKQMMVHPLNFEEFLAALGEEKALEVYKQIPLPEYAHEHLMKLFHEYILVGGMPEVVHEYVQNGKQLLPLNKIYSSIWDNYKNDIEKYGQNNTEKRVLNHIITHAPAIRDRITFNGFGNSQFGSREVAEAFRKLHKAGIIRLIYPSTDLEPPLTPNIKRKPKIQFLDSGLLNYAGNLHVELIGVKDFNSLYRGYLLNHIVFQELISKHTRIDVLPTFWTRESTTANAEIDIITQYKHMIIPVEIKSGTKGSLKSLHEFMDRCSHNIAFRLLSNKFLVEKSVTKSGKEFTLVNLPYYCAGNIDKWIEYVVDRQ